MSALGLFAGHEYMDGVLGECLFGARTAVTDFAEEIGAPAAFTAATARLLIWYLRKRLGSQTRYDPPFKKAYCLRLGIDSFVGRTGWVRLLVPEMA
jgi:hypothetical protein